MEKISQAKHPLIIVGDEASASTNGASSIEAIYALNLVVGNINKEGGLIINPRDWKPEELERITRRFTFAYYFSS